MGHKTTSASAVASKTNEASRVKKSRAQGKKRKTFFCQRVSLLNCKGSCTGKEEKRTERAFEVGEVNSFEYLEWSYINYE